MEVTLAWTGTLTSHNAQQIAGDLEHRRDKPLYRVQNGVDELLDSVEDEGNGRDDERPDVADDG